VLCWMPSKHTMSSRRRSPEGVRAGFSCVVGVRTMKAASVFRQQYTFYTRPSCYGDFTGDFDGDSPVPAPA
jgi:hypothetical protein